jgi:hypothetical protein
MLSGALDHPAANEDVWQLAAADAAWRFEWDDWSGHRPARWRVCRRRRWAASAKELFEEHERLWAQARGLGLLPGWRRDQLR